MCSIWDKVELFRTDTERKEKIGPSTYGLLHQSACNGGDSSSRVYNIVYPYSNLPGVLQKLHDDANNASLRKEYTREPG